MKILKRFLKYVSIDTTSNSAKIDTPSTEGQKKLAKLLVKELKDLNLDMVHYDENHCYVYGILKGDSALPKIGFVSHLDTAEDALGKNIEPKIIEQYNGNDITLKYGQILSLKTFPDLKNHIGKTLITTDGTTLLGADDKAGIAEIMTMLEFFSNSNETHGDIYICFTPDEEIGLGTLHLDKKYFNPDFAYTVDGSNLGEFSYENFNAATATININGVVTHPGSAKDIMINAIHIATIIHSLLPNEIPANTENYEGFFHLENINGDVSHATMEYLIRDFNKKSFENRKKLLHTIVKTLNEKYGENIELNITDSYHNMKEKIKNEALLIRNTLQAIKNLNIEPEVKPIRGGTDGTKISFEGIPCPNLGTGGHNFHSIYEYVCVEDMEKTAEILIECVRLFAMYKREHIKIEINDDNLNLGDVHEVKSKVRAILVDNKNQILIAKYGNVILLPGGKIEENETIDGAIIRELFEETGQSYEVDELEFMTTLKHFQSDYPKRNGTSQNRLIQTHYFIGQYKGISKENQALSDKEKKDGFQLTLIPIEDLEKMVLENETKNPRNKYFQKEILEVLKIYRKTQESKQIKKLELKKKI